jgi:hypothetical protein
LDFKNKLDAHATAIQAEMDAADSDGSSRSDLGSRQLCLTEEIASCRKQLHSYQDSDPTEVEDLKRDLRADFAFATEATEDIYAMESWFKKQGAEELVESFPEQYYKPLDQWSEEEGQMREEDLYWDELFPPGGDDESELGSSGFAESLFAT